MGLSVQDRLIRKALGMGLRFRLSGEVIEVISPKMGPEMAARADAVFKKMIATDGAVGAVVGILHAEVVPNRYHIDNEHCWCEPEAMVQCGVCSGSGANPAYNNGDGVRGKKWECAICGGRGHVPKQCRPRLGDEHLILKHRAIPGREM